jgi:ATP-binding cassette subfamily B (MDR/TAP) protein 1
METGLGDTLVDCVIKICSLLGALIFAFIGSWKLTLIILCLVPFMLISGILKILTAYKAGVLVIDVYQTAGGIAEEILYNIKIIVSFANFDYELKRFYEKTEISALLEKKS